MWIYLTSQILQLMFQILFFIPYICSTVAVSLMWRWILDWEGGILNSILGTNMRWLEDPNTITWCIILATIWQAPGYGIVMYKAAFSNVNQALYEAAEIDGASPLRKLFNITIPMVMPSVTICTFLTLTNSFKMFDQNFALTGGAPGKETSMLALDIYQTFLVITLSIRP